MTDTYLLPFLSELEIFFLELRAAIDCQLATTLAPKKGKPYPLGQCLEITVAVQQLLSTFDPVTLKSPQAKTGYSAYRAFRRAGGDMRQVWGDLRGEFFQNAFQLGSLYLDVSNDTVTPTKPKVELIPFADARFVAIRDFEHFSQIARKYWDVEVYPNHVLPELAPYMPLLCCYRDGQLMLGVATAYMVSLTQTNRLYPSEQVLAAPAMPVTIFQRAREALFGSKVWDLAENPERGRLLALQTCRRLRRKDVATQLRHVNQIVLTGTRVNQQLELATRGSVTRMKNQHTEGVSNLSSAEFIAVDGVQYALAALSEPARQQLQMLQMSEQRLQELQRDLAITQTARNAYLQALKELLPQP
ncbi:DUF6447 family protein [Duganella fentianensis]|uniref:DUF6447 family protein n=1 Tax=Duganella fentianensis TaxID=2692177 RepID=UPI001927A853|nr:DUF6447 family protein [Duganella fentianensis]